MRRKIPSNLALTAFEASARHQSFTKAAQELSLTQSAVCRQVGGLEEFLGLELFRRTRRGLMLTEAGAGYSRQVAARLDELERDALAMMSTGGRGGILELAVSPTFAARWLLPRFGNFIDAHPDVVVNLTSRTQPFLFENTQFDAMIYAGEASWSGTESTFLMRENLVAVGSPNLIAPRSKIDARELGRMRLLQQSPRPYAWRLWFESVGLRVENDLAGPRMELFSMLIEAAIHGMGVALIPRYLIENELRQGLLRELVNHRYLNDRSCYLIYPERKAESSLVRTFGAWLENEARTYRAASGLE
jgi:DNA-binding transcriptional LysR family regulator